jgi:hypothetical protein
MEEVIGQLSASPRSEFLDLEGMEYFRFEEDFMENNMRCIPMIIRFKMDIVGIKLKLTAWKKFSTDERIELALMNCGLNEGTEQYTMYLKELIGKYTNGGPTVLEVDRSPEWNRPDSIPEVLAEKLREFNWRLSIPQWKSLTDLQRFALLKLCRPGHENKNFPKAMREFNLVN